MKYGKLQAQWHPKTLRFGQFASADMVLPDPAKVYWGYKVTDWGMLGNDSAGDCVVAGALHMIMNWSAHTGTPKTFTTDQALQIYSALSGYDPTTGANDNGLVMTDFLEYWRTTGLFGDKILGWMAFDHSNKPHFDTVDFMFGGIFAGQQVPQSAEQQFGAGQPWEIVSNSPIVGGHCTPYFNYGGLGRKLVTWAKLQAAYNDWINSFVDESYGVIAPDWFDTQSKLAPSGFNVDQLWAAVKQLSA